MTGRVMAAVAVALVAASLPVFLLGALSPRIGAELGMTEAGIGLAIGAFFAAAAITAVPGGMVADRIGASAALRTGVVISAVALATIGGVVEGAGALIAATFVAGGVLGLVDPGGARALSAALPAARQGMGFGVKEASIPAASLVVGVALPLLAGWRGAFLAAAAAAGVVAALIPRGLDDPTTGAAPQVPAGPGDGSVPLLAAIAVAAGLGGGAAAVAATFLVPSALSTGWSTTAAGILLVVASATGIGVRLAAGRLADAWPGRELRLVTAAMLVGAVGIAGLATAALPVAAVLALGAGWGWTGLVFLAAVRVLPARPARAAGAVLAGLGIGGALGPISFGLVVAAVGYPAAWTSASLVMVTAAAVAGTAARAQTRVRHRSG